MRNLLPVVEYAWLSSCKGESDLCVILVVGQQDFCKEVVREGDGSVLGYGRSYLGSSLRSKN